MSKKYLIKLKKKKNGKKLENCHCYSETSRIFELIKFLHKLSFYNWSMSWYVLAKRKTNLELSELSFWSFSTLLHVLILFPFWEQIQKEQFFFSIFLGEIVIKKYLYLKNFLKNHPLKKYKSFHKNCIIFSSAWQTFPRLTLCCFLYYCRNFFFFKIRFVPTIEKNRFLSDVFLYLKYACYFHENVVKKFFYDLLS